jgi:hypothetical protein
MSDTTTTIFDETMLEAWAANVKAMFEQHLRDGEREREQVNDWRAFGLEQARQNAQIINRLAQDSATISARYANDGANFSAAQAAQMNRQAVNAGTSDQLFSALQAVVGSEILNNQNASQTSAERLSSETAKGFQDTAKAALDTVIANSAQASPLPQGTVGVAQGSLQTAEAASTNAMMTQLAVANNAIMAQVAKLAEVVDVLLLKVTADTTTVRPA